MKFESAGIETKKEPSILDSFENQIALARRLEDVYSHRPDMKKFVGAVKNPKFAEEYTAEKVQQDIDYVERTRVAIEEKNSSMGQEVLNRSEGGFALSEMMQAMVVDRINNGWLKDFKAIMTSDYDDLRVGIDAVMKHEGGSYLGAAFDFTVSSRGEQIAKKLDTMWERNIEKGSVPKLKYFEDPDTHEKSSLLVLKFIIGGSKQDVEDMAKAYLAGDEATLGKHPFRYLMLEQISEQLRVILSFYEAHPDDQKLKFAYQQYQKIESVIEQAKKDIGYDEFKKGNTDFHAYAKESTALAEIKMFGLKRIETK